MKKRILWITVSLLFLIPAFVKAQYFGRNKVVYEDFNFRVMETEHFKVYHYPREFKAIQNLGQMAERWYKRHSATFQHHFDFKNPLVIYANQADFQQTTIIRSNIGVATGGVTEARRNRVIMPFAETNKSTNHVLGHELVHAFQYDLARTGQFGSIRATSRMPLWFIEGMAEYLSIGAIDAHTAMWMRDAVLQKDVPTIKEVAKSRKYFPYRYGHAIWSYITGKWGDDVVESLYQKALKYDIKTSFQKVLGIPMDSVSTLWRDAIKDRYKPMVERRNKPSKVGEKLLAPKNNSGSRNLSPSLSPNGEYVAYISDRGLFSLELYLADAETGKVIKKLTSTLTNPHLNALRFIQSSGTWGPESKRFAYVIFAQGDNQIAITNVKSGEVIRRKKFNRIGSITNPAWSPNGNKIAFSGSVGGYSNLYLYNLRTDSLRQLTSDKYSDLQPTWSPSGDRLAFVTDRGSGTNFRKLTFGEMNIAIYDFSSGKIEVLPGFDGYKHINPQFSSDGRSIYFISDFEGFSDVYRYELKSDRIYRITKVNTGISGISGLSPAMTVSRETGDMIVTVFNNQNYIGYKIPEKQTDGTLVRRRSPRLEAGRLPPVKQGNILIADYLRTPRLPSVSDTAFSLHDYQKTLFLEYIGGMGRLGVATNQYQSRIAGGISMRFSDMLNQHSLYTHISSRGSFKDIGAEVGYLNMDKRWQWGGSISHFPFKTTTGFVQDTTVTLDEKKVRVRQINRITRRVFQDRINLQAIYPFSSTLRFESNVSYSYIWYDTENQITTVVGNQVINRRTVAVPELEPDPTHLYGGSVALVGDNSISGFTGPIRGHRFRFELEPSFGTLQFLSATADYRRYFFVRPFTVAFRGMHLGRYFADATSQRLSPYYIGLERLVRGYNFASFGRDECLPAQSSRSSNGCPAFNRLMGSKIGIFNAEIRVPLLGVEPLSLLKTRMFPTTLTAFFDGGVAWSGDRLPNLTWTTDVTAERAPVFSTGVSARVNLAGYIVTEIYLAYPFQRPEQGAYAGFHISPGW